MAAVFKTIFDINGDSWRRFYNTVNRDLSSLQRRGPGLVLGGMLGGAGLGAAAFAGRALVRAPQDILDVHRAVQLSEGRLAEGQLWDLLLKERPQQLEGVLTGGASNVASIMHMAERLDPKAIEYRERFLGGETQNVAEAMRFAVGKYADASGVIQQEMREVLPFLRRDKARRLAGELLPENLQLLDFHLQRASETALSFHNSLKQLENIVIKTITHIYDKGPNLFEPLGIAKYADRILYRGIEAWMGRDLSHLDGGFAKKTADNTERIAREVEQ